MAEICRDFERWETRDRAGTLSERERRLWREHLWSCGDCRAELTVVHELRRFGAAQPAPVLSPGFAARVARAARREPALPRLAPAMRRWLIAYWDIALAASGYIVYRTPLPPGLVAALSTWGAISVAAAAGVAALFPGRALRRTLAVLSR